MEKQSNILAIIRGLCKILESGRHIVIKDVDNCIKNSSLNECFNHMLSCSSKCGDSLNSKFSGLTVKNIQKNISRNLSTSVSYSTNNDLPLSRYYSHETIGVPIDSSGMKKKKETKLKNESKLKAKESKVPGGRLGRLASFGNLGAGLMVGALSELAQRTFSPSKENKTGSILDNNLILSEANAERIVATLCRVRGAALKLGQMLSIQDNSLINPTIQKIFERMRQSADYMPTFQMEEVISKELGVNWKDKFESFDIHPFAAASIGQVHLAILRNGKKVAVKVQYPGVADSINSDIKNLLSLMKVSKILPDGLYADKALKVAAKELTLECDYIREGKSSQFFRTLIEKDPIFSVPNVHWDLTTKKVLTTDFVDGISLDLLEGESQELRNKVSLEILRLCLDEVFKFRFMQTDPNWSNFLYDSSTNKIHLIDFGASREFDKKFVDSYIELIRGASIGDQNIVLQESKNMGFLTGYETKIMESAHVDAVMILGEAFANDGPFDFAKQSTASRIHDLIPVMLKHRLTPPPEETYSLHRKMSGCFLLCTKLKANIPCKKLFDAVLLEYKK